MLVGSELVYLPEGHSFDSHQNQNKKALIFRSVKELQYNLQLLKIWIYRSWYIWQRFYKKTKKIPNKSYFYLYNLITSRNFQTLFLLTIKSAIKQQKEKVKEKIILFCSFYKKTRIWIWRHTVWSDGKSKNIRTTFIYLNSFLVPVSCAAVSAQRSCIWSSHIFL